VSLTPSEVERSVRDAVESGRVERTAASYLAARLDDPAVFEPLLEGASESTRRARGDRVTVSRNVFIPLTNLCRDRCAYCTFAKTPDSPEAKTYTLDEVAAVVKGGVATGCSEALFCLGDKPEIAYRAHREWLEQRGFRSTAEYLVEGCRIAVEGGMLPHTNAGILSQSEMAALKRWNVSMGLMLESTSPRLRGKGMAHQYAPDKDPAVRLRMHEEAGELGIPFTTGMLLGIGENADERVDTLLAIRALHDRHGHIQEAIIQPFHPKPGTRMRWASPLPDREIAGWVALARLVLGREIDVQAPPNLAPGLLELLLGAGTSDWGGVSPVTVDFINPEAPWPTLVELRARTEAAGQRLVERLPVYPQYLGRPEFFAPELLPVALGFADENGLARARASLEAA
jgi:FO synthase